MQDASVIFAATVSRLISVFDLTLPPSDRLTRVLGPVVLPLPTLMQVFEVENPSRSAV
jgi:hypothetical protein